MKPREPLKIRFHEDTDLFREAVNFTAASTAFTPRLIEKDYFCTILLEHLATTAAEKLVFRGGTCLAKVHAEFYRLSEDLDFLISTPPDASRAERSHQAVVVKKAATALPDAIPYFRLVEPVTGANSSRQYIGVVGYKSLLTQQEETIRIEVGLREQLLTPAINGLVRTILLDPVTGAPMVPPVTVHCISKTEAMAEKFRAALTRREVAIRDFYDIDHVVKRLGVHLEDEELVTLTRQKLAVPGNDPINISDERLTVLRKQLESQLKPVLREQDLAEFDLDRVFKTVTAMAKRTA
jgi:predicted nucleotidyltransferase component of viral defense system